MKFVLSIALLSSAIARPMAPGKYQKGFVRRARPLSFEEVGTVKLTAADYAAAPDVVDWSAIGATTAVKDQGMCGSCWAYSTTEGIESAIWMQDKNATIPELAPQQIISCDHKEAAGCSGGDLPSALDYVMQAGGIEAVKDYPDSSADTGENGTCTADATKVRAKVTGYKYAVPPCSGGDCKAQDEEGLAVALATYGPISICVNAGDGHWDYYESGIWPPAAHPCMSDWDLIDHCVQLVGYDKTASTPYWKIRNSWASSWGEDGFIRLPMGVNACGLADEAVLINAELV